MTHKIKKIIVATRNEGKLREIKHILKDFGWEILSLKEFPEIGEIIEDGYSFYENALIKARAVYEITKIPTLADDSGICVEYLDFMPGIFSARFAGDECDDKKNNKKLYKLLKGVPREQRKAYFKCSMVFVYAKTKELHAGGKMHGYINEKEQGKNGFGYDPMFYIPRYEVTSAELPPEKKNKISHRYKALMGIKKLLGENFNG